MGNSWRRLVRRWTPATALAMLVGPVPAAAAQDPPWKLPATADFPNRYEGVIAPEVANPDFELLSFTGPVESKGTRGALKVDFYLPADGTATVEARELRNDKYYRMVSKPSAWTSKAWNSFGPWPAADVIVPARVSLDNIGVVVYLKGASGQSGQVAPAFVHGRAPNAGARYTFVFRTPRTTLAGVQYSLRSAGASADVWSKSAAGDFIRGTPIYLEFDAALAPGSYTLRVTCEPVSAAAARITREFTFYHARR